jgi:formylglycine-generating enzyme required for sulfatase activity
MTKLTEGMMLLERYRILKHLGAGICGTVYQAWDSLREANVAIKVLHPDVVQEWGGFDRIRPVLADMCQLHHPAICSVFDFQRYESTALIFEEYVEGISLERLIPEGGVPVGWKGGISLVDVCISIGQALAHAADICPHGHFHPGQVLLTKEGQVRMTDFGLARLWETKALRNISRFRRTLQYVPPDRREREKDAETALGDQFSFGMVVTDLITLVGGERGDGSGFAEVSGSEAKQLERSLHRLTQALPKQRFTDWARVMESLNHLRPSLQKRHSVSTGHWLAAPSQNWIRVLWGLGTIAMVLLIWLSIRFSADSQSDFSQRASVEQLMSERGRLRGKLIQLAATDPRWMPAALARAEVSAPDSTAHLLAKWDYFSMRGEHVYARLTMEDLESDLVREVASVEVACQALEAATRLMELREQYDQLVQRRNPTPPIAYAVDTLYFLYHHRENEISKSPPMTRRVAELKHGLSKVSPLLPSSLKQPDSLGIPLLELHRLLEQGLYGEAKQSAQIGVQILQDVFRLWEDRLVEKANRLQADFLEMLKHNGMVNIPKPPFPDQLIEQGMLSCQNDQFQEGMHQLIEGVEVFGAWVDELRGIPEPAGKQMVNSIGMRFVPVNSFWASIWETRICDFNTFVAETGTDSRRLWREKSDPVALTHPVVSVARHDARAFCRWLTERDRAAGLIGLDQVYRLPTDREWSLLVDLHDESGASPEARSWHDVAQYPWGNDGIRTAQAGNYGTSPSATPQNGYHGNMDPWMRTSPVGSFHPNPLGLYDLGGNVWELASDSYYGERGDRHYRTLRGGSWRTLSLEFMRSNYRHFSRDAGEDIGFRIILAPITTSNSAEDFQKGNYE